MIDYKLILILVLSIVLLYLYNKVDSLKYDIIKMNKNFKEEVKKIENILINNNCKGYCKNCKEGEYND